MKKIIFSTLILLGASSLALADECKSWGHKAYPVTMEACSNRDGGSGYYRITNDVSQPATICWSVVSNDGRTDEGCHSNLGAGESTRGSCFDCGSKNKGVKYILLQKYK
jgi:hypothetical protein